MVTMIGAFSGFSVRDVSEATEFWQRVGLRVRSAGMGNVYLELPDGAPVLMYPKGDAHVAADYTVLNLQVPDLAAAIRELAEVGVEPLRYDGMPQDEDGGMRGNGPDIAWFADPSGNVFSTIVPPADAP